MTRFLILASFLFTSVLQAQQLVTGTMSPTSEEFSWVSLYRLVGAKQLYIDNSTISNGGFTISIPNDSPSGMYRLIYKMDGKSQIDFIYSNESIELKFDPLNPNKTVIFEESNENRLWSSYKKETGVLIQQLDSIQYAFFYGASESEEKNATERYEKLLVKFKETQESFELRSENTQAFHFIKATNKYYSNKLLKRPQTYVNSLRTHFFDYIDFSDKVLMNSTFLSEKVINYVFYLNDAEDVEVRNALFKNASKTVIDKTGENLLLKAELITSLMYSFSQTENIVLLDFLMDNYYKKLPVEYQNTKDVEAILENTKLAIGRQALDFSWNNNEIEESLYNIEKADYFVLVFWSSTCSHCKIEIPKLYDFTKDSKTIRVISVSLETDDKKFKEYKEQFKNWTTVLGMGKWNNPIARSYNIVSTPTYFILDSSKKIIAKPEYFENVQVFFTNLI